MHFLLNTISTYLINMCCGFCLSYYSLQGKFVLVFFSFLYITFNILRDIDLHWYWWDDVYIREGIYIGLGLGYSFHKYFVCRDWIYVIACKVVFNLKLDNFDRFITGMVLLFRGVNLNERCSWCHYLSCVPTSKWSCQEQSIYCEVSAHFLCIFYQFYFLVHCFWFKHFRRLLHNVFSFI